MTTGRLSMEGSRRLFYDALTSASSVALLLPSSAPGTDGLHSQHVQNVFKETPHWACGARLLSNVGQPAVEASTFSRAQPTVCCIRLSSEEHTMKEWRSRPVLIIVLIQEDDIEQEEKKWSEIGAREYGLHGRSITNSRPHNTVRY